METLLEQACRPAILGRSDAQVLTALARTRHVEVGQQVLSRNEPAASLWLVASGRVALVDGTRSLMMKDVPARCASWLLQHADIDGGGTMPQTSLLQLRQRKRSIAAQLGTTAETLSRTLRQLSERGLIEVRGYEIRL